MDVDRLTNLPEELMSDCQSFSSKYQCGSQSRKISIGVLVDSFAKAETCCSQSRKISIGVLVDSFAKAEACCSQSRKISIGVLVDSFAKAETKDIKEAVTQVAEHGTTNKGHSLKDCEGHSPCVEKHVKVSQDTTPWISTRSFNPKTSSSVAVHDAERTLNFPATSKVCPTSKLLEKALAAHSLKFVGKTGLECNEAGEKNFGKSTYSTESGNVNNAQVVENLVLSNEQGFVLENERAEYSDRKTETMGCETLRMKFWEILGNVSSPNKRCSVSQHVELHPDKARDGKHPPVEESTPSPDTIESDSERSNHTPRRPLTRSLSRKKANTKNQHINIEAKRSTCSKNACPRKRIFSFRGDRPSFPSKRKKIERESSGLETCQRHKYENAEERQQSENKSIAIPAVDESMVHRGKVHHANSSNDDRISDVFVEPKSSNMETNTFQSPLNAMTEQQKNVQQQRDVENQNLTDQQKNIANSLLTKSISVQDPPSPTFDITSPGCLPRTNQGKLHDQSPSKEILNTKGIRSFNSFLSSKSAECKRNARVKSSNDRGELNDCHLMKPSFTMEEDRENRMSKSSTDGTSSESSEDDSHVKGIGDSSELKICSEQNHEDGLASAVELFTVALDRVKTKLNSMANKRSSEILRAAAEEIFLQLKNAESQIKEDVGKLSNHSQSKRKRLETQFRDQWEQLLGIYKRFREAVDQHLQDYGNVVEEHEVELKRTVERRRAAHKMFISQVEQDIKLQLDDAESRIMSVQELARKKMLQLKLVVDDCIKQSAFC